jgi:hypothetical protein
MKIMWVVSKELQHRQGECGDSPAQNCGDVFLAD